MNNKIKEELINNLKERYHDHIFFNISDIKRIVDKIPESDFTPISIEKDIDADEDKLFDKNVSDVINYLSLYKDYKLCQRWNGYEDNYFVFSKKVVETENDIFNRLFMYVNDNYLLLLGKKCELDILNKKNKKCKIKLPK